jgi:DNA-binding transcriptional LysR family regulator
MIDVGKLATLRAVVDHGSFSAAADAVGLTQPAVSRQVSLLERQVGTQLVLRTHRGVRATPAGRLLVEHADAIVRRLSMAERQLADLAGLRRGEAVLGSFFTALVYLSAEVGAWIDARYPEVVLRDELVDRAAAFQRLATGELDAAIVFEHTFEPDTAPSDVELISLFDDPGRVLLPAEHPLAGGDTVSIRDLARDTWVRPHDGSAARLLDHVLTRNGLQPRLIAAGRGDEPVEAQALIAAGKAVMLAHNLNVIISPDRIAVRRAQQHLPSRTIQAAVMRAQRSATTQVVLQALQEVGLERTQQD